MWLSRWVSGVIVGIVLASAAPAHAAPSHLGGTSAPEAELIWKDGQAAFEAGRYREAVTLLRRLINRYPGHAGFLEAHRLLGVSFLELGRPAEALAPLRQYANASRATGLEAQLVGKIWLARAQLALNKGAEALLLADEIRKKSARDRTRAEAQLLRAHALILQNRDVEAAGATDQSLTQLRDAPSPELLAEAKSLLLEILIRQCSRLPSKGGMDEAQARDQLERRATCQQDTLKLLHDVADADSGDTLTAATEAASAGYVELAERCLHPPDPLPLPKGKRSAEQLTAYRADLRRLILPVCQSAFSRATDTLQEWKFPTKDRLQAELQKQRNRLQGSATP